MGAELAGVLTWDVVLVGIVLKDHQIGDRLDEADLTYFLLEAQEEHDSIVLGDIDFPAEVATQVSLFGAAQPAQVALTVRRDALVKAVENGALLFLHQK
ncbi:hypothetical protein D3C76_810080 [compost metagenome]